MFRRHFFFVQSTAAELAEPDCHAWSTYLGSYPEITSGLTIIREVEKDSMSAGVRAICSLSTTGRDSLHWPAVRRVVRGTGAGLAGKE